MLSSLAALLMRAAVVRLTPTPTPPPRKWDDLQHPKSGESICILRRPFSVLLSSARGPQQRRFDSDIYISANEVTASVEPARPLGGAAAADVGVMTTGGLWAGTHFHIYAY